MGTQEAPIQNSKTILFCYFTYDQTTRRDEWHVENNLGFTSARNVSSIHGDCIITIIILCVVCWLSKNKHQFILVATNCTTTIDSLASSWQRQRWLSSCVVNKDRFASRQILSYCFPASCCTLWNHEHCIQHTGHWTEEIVIV